MAICENCGVDHSWTMEQVKTFNERSTKIMQDLNTEGFSAQESMFMLAMAAGSMTVAIAIIDDGSIHNEMNKFMNMYIKTIRVITTASDKSVH